METGITAAIAILVFAAMGTFAARSVVLGGLTFILPNAMFIAFALRPGQALGALRGLYVGEALKLFATALLFAAGFALVKPLSVAVLFVTYVTLLIVNLAGNAYLMD